MDVGPIPWTALDAYAARHGFERDDYDLLAYVVSDMDVEYLEWARKKTKSGGGE